MASSSSSMSSRPIQPKSGNSSPPIKSSSARDSTSRLLWQAPGAVSATLNDRVLTFLNRARKVTLEPLSVGDVDACYQRAFEELGLDIPSGLRLDAARATQGSPYMLQLIGYNIANRCQAGEHVTPKQVDGAIEASKADFENDVCETTLARALGPRCCVSRRNDRRVFPSRP